MTVLNGCIVFAFKITYKRGDRFLKNNNYPFSQKPPRTEYYEKEMN